MKLKLQGFEIVWPEGKRTNENFEIDIPPGEEHIVILRRFANEC